MTVKDVESAAMRLSTKARARLAARLIASLDKRRDEDAEQAWYDEAERRDKAYREGRLKGRPAEEVFRELRSKLR
jgi:putative addiction module component (TIGR02574 family)